MADAANLHDAIRDALLAEATVTAIVGTRIVRGWRPDQAPVHPFIAFGDSDVQKINVDQLVVGGDRFTFWLELVGYDPDVLLDLESAVETAVKAIVGSATGYAQIFAQLGNTSTAYSPESGRHRRVMTLFVNTTRS